MAASTVVKNFTDGSITLADGTGSPVTLTVDFDEGDFSVSPVQQQYSEVVTYESRGTLKSVRHTNRVYPTGSFSLKFTEFTAASYGTLVDFICKQNNYSGNTSTLSTGVYTIDVTLTIEGTDHGDDADHTIDLTDCHCTIDFSEGDPNTLTVNFTCYGAVTMTGSAA